ncbi:MAG: low molecular weight phosphatase family protein [Oxalobacteraceae bacterium]|nr:MAG: low molecular weight phosphatase family protein [Oxalobacteraceae bacterium]
MEPPRSKSPQAVLFACGMNSVRSPMAASLMQSMFPKIYSASAGVRKADVDGFAVSVMDEIGRDIATHKPMTFEELEDWEGLNFDLIVTLSPEAHHKALELTRTIASDVEYWPTPDPVGTEGTREQQLDAYRAVRDGLMNRIVTRFGTGMKGAA